MCLSDVVQYGEKDDEQFLVKVHHFLFVYRVCIYRLALQKYRGSGGDGLLPLDSVESRMDVFGNKCEVILIVFVEVTKGYNHVEQGIVFDLFPLAFALVFLAFENIVVVCLFVYTDGSVYPD